RDSLDSFERLRTSAVGADRRGWAGLVQRGTTFVAYPSEGGLAFAPSRFIGYRDNNLRAHSENPLKDGRDTNPAIERVLGSKPAPSRDLENAYRQFCVNQGIEPRPAGSFGVTRTYWVLPEARQYLGVAPSYPSTAEARSTQFTV